MGEKVTVPDIIKKNRQGEKVTCLTAYDYSFARILDEAGIDILLVGDSVGCVFQGKANTLPVTMEEMIYNTRAVARGRLLQEGGAEGVKLEGGLAMQATIEAIVKIGIPVMGHVGLTPQSVHRFGGYKIQGKNKEQREAVMGDALAVEDTGAFAVVLEGIPLDLAKEISERLTIPTIGIGAGPHCDGQVLVIHDMLGLFEDFTPKFVKRYADIKEVMTGAVKSFIADVRERKFPGEEHSFR